VNKKFLVSLEQP